MKGDQAREKRLAFGGAAVPGRLEVAGTEARSTGELQFREDSAIVFWGSQTVGGKSPHKGKAAARLHL
jgi:hypothetical protein